MKRILRQFFALLLIFILPLQAGAGVLGDALLESRLPVGQTSSLSQTTHRDESGRLRQETYLLSGGDLMHRVVYGTTLYGKSAMDTMEAYPHAWGFSVAAGVNGSFFDMATGIPYGCVITGGAVRSSGDLEAVGFRTDGSVVMGKPGLSIQMTFPTAQAPSELHVNKTLTKSGGMVLYTRDFDKSTRSGPAFNVVLMPDRPDLTLGSTLICTVTDILPDTENCPIPAGGFVLSMAADTDYPATLQNILTPLMVGDVLQLSVNISEPWLDVDSACAGMEMLLENGKMAEKFTLSSAKNRTARTAIGVTADGSLLLYTADNGSGITGLTLEELSLRLLELGCVTAMNLDGGGSTAIRALYPGMDSTQTVNRPSDGVLRKCANFIFLLRPQAEAGPAAKLFAYPHDAVALPGGRIPLTLKATDENYISAPVPEHILFEAQGGTVEDGVFIAESPGTAKVTMTAENAAGEFSVRVLESPESIAVIREMTGKDAAGTGVMSGVTLSLTAKAKFAGKPVYAQDESFVWTCDSAIGTIDEAGLFTAAAVYEKTSGTVTCAAGDAKCSITVNVFPTNPFRDTETHWAKEQIRAMYEAGVLTGSQIEGELLFRPDDAMTRQEFVTALMRLLKAESTETELPFRDAEAIAPWALDAAKQAYAMGLVTGSLREGVLYFDPQSPITRQEAMVILSRTLPQQQSPQDLLSAFPDAADCAPWALEGLNRMLQEGIISGYADGTLSPTALVTRAQVAKMLFLMK